MATTKIGNGNITFGDNTSLSSANLPYANITNKKTNLSQFTNDLGNYGGFFPVTGVDTTAHSTGAFANIGVGVNSAGNLTLITDGNCNCNCNCNC